MRPLTITIPKPLVSTIQARPLLDHIISALPENVDEIILVVGYLREKIVEYFGDHYQRFRIEYVRQQKPTGTYSALELCERHLKTGEPFLVMYADDLYGPEPIQEIAASKELALLASRVKDPRKFGVLEVDDQGFITGIEEKPLRPKSNLVSTGVMLLDDRVFRFPPPPGAKGECVLADSVGLMIQGGIRFRSILTDDWFPLADLKDLERLNRKIDRRKSKRGEPAVM